jgi:hypothetical protein
MKHSNCTVKGCLSYGRYCRLHPNGSLKETKPIKPLSAKRQKIQQTEYGPAAKEYLKKNPLCKIRSEVCTGKAEGVHHKAGRIGDKLTDQRYWMPACNKCNSYVEQNDLWARSNGFKLSKFTH